MNTYNLKPWIINVLNNQQISAWTPIQEKTLSLSLHHKNFIGISPTGTGKTLTYVLPILQHLDYGYKGIQAIIICPTRELGRQVASVFKDFKNEDYLFKVGLWIGGMDLVKLINDAKINPAQIIICTPQRFLEVAKELPSTIFTHVNTFVLDEADMLLDLNFYPQIHQIVNNLEFDNIHKIAVSATLHDNLNNELKKIYNQTTVINLNKLDVITQKIDHYIIKTNDKNHALSSILNTINPYFCLIFTNTTKKADEIYKLLLAQNRSVINLHSKLSTRARKNNYKDIKNQKFQYVVASDLFSRGMDIDGASHVINYDLPDSPEWYFHRAGRVGRSKYQGISYVLFSPNDQEKLDKLLDKKIIFKTKQIKNNELVDHKLRLRKPQVKNDIQEQEIKKIINNSYKEVKPGYKKKLRAKIQKIKQKHKHEHIEKLVNNQRKLSYKQSNKTK